MVETTIIKCKRISVGQSLLLVLAISTIIPLATLLLQQPVPVESPLLVDHPHIATPSSNVTVGMVLFTPEFVKEGRLQEYVNIPPYYITREVETAVRKAIDRPAGEAQGLLYEAHPPGRDVVMGISAYTNNMDTFVQFVGSLRLTGYDGHIILGVHKDISQEERDYLESMDVTMYAVEFVPCGKNGEGVCAKGFETLKLEWCRFEMCRQWLRACKDCTGWALVMDTRDAFFQAKPFASLPDPSKSPYDLLFIEEIAQHTCPDPHAKNNWRWYNIKDNFRYKPHTELCYGVNHWLPYGDRPVLCSGTTIGNRAGIDRFLSVMSDEFYRSTTHELDECRSPSGKDTDQWIMIYLYYQGKFGRPDRTRTVPWGTGPVNTVGHACINRVLDPPHSQRDIVLRENATGLILNNHESLTSPARVAAVIHQFDRCHDWIYNDYMPQHQNMFSRESRPTLSWKQQK
jgi:hypothetical protein